MSSIKGKINPQGHYSRSRYRQEISLEEIKSGNVVELSRAITLLESDQPDDREQAQKLLLALPVQLPGWRIGISGPPGAGKSSLIEKMGLYLCNEGHQVAVLAIDPTSSLSGGSILGDKTRMEHLARNPRAFIRPSPTKGVLGGVSAYTREVSQLCALAGYDIILIETVGVGQSEYSIRDIVDFMVLVLAPGAGDDLQSIKRGIIEVADLFAINKSDGEFKNLAQKAFQDLKNAQRGNQKPVLQVSALENMGIREIWTEIQRILSQWVDAGKLELLRTTQDLNWLYRIFELRVSTILWEHTTLASVIEEQRQNIKDRKLSPMQGALNIIKVLESLIEKESR